jgi:tRNA(fMet)-specific endonuclease VapC
MYLLDINTCIVLKNKKPLHILDKLRSVVDLGVYISSITVAELQFGVYNSQNIEKNRISLTEFFAPFTIIDFDDNDAGQFGKIR